MADTKISGLPASTTPLAGTEVLPIVQSGSTVKVAVSDLTAGRAVATGALTVTGTLSSTLGATIQGLTVGLGAGAVSTNTAVGVTALSVNVSGASNTALGYEALKVNTASTNTAVGYQAGFKNSTGELTAIGTIALYENTIGEQNTAVGYVALTKNTTGSYNTGIGRNSIRLNETGSYNTGLGVDSLYNNLSASYNTAVGYQAGYTNQTGIYGVFLGYQAGHASTSNSNIMIGYQAGNTTTGNNNICIGTIATTSAAGDSGEIVMGTNVVTGKGSSTGFISPNGGGVYQGNNSLSWSITSDQRIKKNIVDNNTGLSIVNQIRVRNFEYRLPEEITELPQGQAVAKTGVQLGVIAQELQQILPECVKTESTGVMSVDTDNLIWYAINAIKQLSAEVESLKSQLNQRD